MRYRKLDASGDMTFGHGGLDFLVNSPAAVAQAVLTALKLIAGEWFLDITAGVPYATEILGNVSQATADLAVRTAMLNVQGVTEIVSYSSSLALRKLTVAATLNSQYGQVNVAVVLP